jgi:hypothetical protein
MHDATKAERRAARERVSAYDTAELAKLVEHVERAIGRHRVGETDVHDVDAVIHRYSKGACELSKFCWSGRFGLPHGLRRASARDVGGGSGRRRLVGGGGEASSQAPLVATRTVSETSTGS